MNGEERVQLSLSLFNIALFSLPNRKEEVIFPNFLPIGKNRTFYVMTS